MINHRTRKIKK